MAASELQRFAVTRVACFELGARVVVHVLVCVRVARLAGVFPGPRVPRRFGSFRRTQTAAAAASGNLDVGGTPCAGGHLSDHLQNQSVVLPHIQVLQT